ncbi:MAG: hypothetical protein AAF889_11735 [Cyanobacteria bacterium P01_D01_bin.73]
MAPRDGVLIIAFHGGVVAMFVVVSIAATGNGVMVEFGEEDMSVDGQATVKLRRRSLPDIMWRVF